MLVVAFIQWWFGPGWNDAAHRLTKRLHHTYLSFSVPALATTLFAPWRRIVTPPDGPLGQKMRAALDNAISRAVGFIVRLCTLIAALLALAVEALFGGLVLLVWPVAPLLGPVLIVVGML